MKPLIIGEGPSRSGDRYYQFPLSGQVGKRLCTWAGIPPLDRDRSMSSEYARWYWALREHFDLANFYERWPQDWTPSVSVKHFREEWEPQLVGRVVVLLGVRVQSAFRLAAFSRSSSFFSWEKCESFSTRRCWIVTVPHPSGMNRVYNEALPQQQTGRVLQRAITLGEQWP